MSEQLQMTLAVTFQQTVFVKIFGYRRNAPMSLSMFFF